jgi:hypothetical protein
MASEGEHIAVRGIHFGAVVGRQALWATVSVVESHRSDDPESKVGRWPTFGGVTVPKWIPLSGNMGDYSSRSGRLICGDVGAAFVRCERCCGRTVRMDTLRW